jgi:hypothetical protein
MGGESLSRAALGDWDIYAMDVNGSRPTSITLTGDQL